MIGKDSVMVDRNRLQEALEIVSAAAENSLRKARETESGTVREACMASFAWKNDARNYLRRILEPISVHAHRPTAKAHNHGS